MDEIILMLAESDDLEKGDNLSFRFFNHSVIVTLQRDYSLTVDRVVPLEILRQAKTSAIQQTIQELITEIILIH